MLKTEETKVLRDPIHGYIHVDLKVVWDCINAKEMQRLRRIHQLGGDFQVYHTAEHSRFSHSLGVYEIVRRMVYEIDQLREGERMIKQNIISSTSTPLVNYILYPIYRIVNLFFKKLKWQYLHLPSVIHFSNFSILMMVLVFKSK